MIYFVTVQWNLCSRASFAIYQIINKNISLYMFAVVNFDALAQESDFWIKRRQVVFLCWMQDSNPGSQRPNRQQTECPLTDPLSYWGSSYKTWNSTALPYDQQAFSPFDPLPVGFRTWLWRYTCLLLISMLWHRQAIFESKGNKLSFSAECITQLCVHTSVQGL